LDFFELVASVDDDAGLVRHTFLRPIGGVGDRILPPTYPGERNTTVHLTENRVRNGVSTTACVLDTVPAQRNRIVRSLLELCVEHNLPLPRLVVDIASMEMPGRSEISSIELPHGPFDAAIRDSLLDGVEFFASGLGKAMRSSTPSAATAMLEHSPLALLTGTWDSTTGDPGKGVKFRRAMTAEIVGYNVELGKRSASRLDPFGISRDVAVYITPSAELAWTLTPEKGARAARPSEINHGNIPPTITEGLGITCEAIEQTFSVGFAALRTLRFGSAEKSKVARGLLAALACLANCAQMRSGYALRSRCDLVVDKATEMQIIAADGSTTAWSPTLDELIALYHEAVKAVRAANFVFDGIPTVLQPQPKFVELVRRSREAGVDRKKAKADAAAR
jgi:CRISPR-associated protein Csb1